MRHARGAFDWRVSRSTTRRSGRSARPAAHPLCGWRRAFQSCALALWCTLRGEKCRRSFRAAIRRATRDWKRSNMSLALPASSARGAAGRVATGARAPRTTTPVFDDGDQPFSCDSTLRTICASGLLSADWGANLIWANVTTAKAMTTRAADAAMRGMYFTGTSFRRQKLAKLTGGRITSAPWLSTTGKAAHGVRSRLAIWTALQKEGRPKPSHYKGFTRVCSVTPGRQWLPNS